MSQNQSLDLAREGPFPQCIDPWAEAARYFHQLHGGIISQFVEQLAAPLFEHGYLLRREASLQIQNLSYPDLAVLNPRPGQRPPGKLDYERAAAAIQVDAGIPLVWETPAITALHVIAQADHALVAVIEIVSPGNKIHPAEIMRYQEQRARLVNEQGAHVIEVDLTRSIKRLFSHPAVNQAPYHVALFIAGGEIRLLPLEFGVPLRPWGLPLREAALPVDLHGAYRAAYRQLLLGWQIYHETDYAVDALPFPSTLTPDQQSAALESAQQWKQRLR